jgi:hypothetical protein
LVEAPGYGLQLGVVVLGLAEQAVLTDQQQVYFVLHLEVLVAQAQVLGVGLGLHFLLRLLYYKYTIF